MAKHRHFNRILRRGLIFASTLLVMVLAANNRTPVELSLFPFPYSATLPLFAILLVTFAFGLLCGGLVITLESLRMKRVLKQSLTRARALENELRGLKAETSTPTSLPVAMP